PARLSVTLTNRKPFIPSCSITVEAHARREEATAPSVRRRKRRKKTPAPLRLAHFISVPPRSEAKQIVEHTFEKRGRYKIDGFNLVTRFPSGFFRKWRRVDADGEIVVFPTLRSIGEFFNALPILAGAAESRVRGEGVDLYALRDYQITDH